MGFKFKRVDFTGESESFPTGSGDSAIRTRSENVLKAVADALIAMDIGWQLDTNRNATTSDFADVPCWSGSNTFPGLFFVNTVSGCKMFMAYFGGSMTDSYAIKDFGRVNNNATDIFGYGKMAHHAGLITSIIPDNSVSAFGSSFDAYFLPADATRMVGTMFMYQSSGNSAYAYSPTAGNIYSWGVYATPYTIAISAGYGSTVPNLVAPSYANGRIFGTLAHDSDTSANAKYGVIIFKKATTYEGLGDLFRIQTGYTFGFSGTVYAPGVPTTSSDGLGSYTTVSMSKADGSWLNANYKDGDVVNGVFYTSDIAQLSGRMYNSTGNGKSRWVPLAVSIISADISTDGVVPGDGFKGYLDTDLFRCARGTYGQQFDNGNFICPENNYNLLIGWDQTNTDQIAGT